MLFIILYTHINFFIYRRYDKVALEKAVASVRSGEMSVHRAGSFYGVPHSTLEYKVKERNLLRHKTRRTPATLSLLTNNNTTNSLPDNNNLNSICADSSAVIFDMLDSITENDNDDSLVMDSIDIKNLPNNEEVLDFTSNNLTDSIEF